MQTTHDHNSSDWIPTISEILQGLWSSTRSWLDKWILEPARKRRIYRKTVEELQALDDRMLRDIGIARCQIHEIAYNRAYGTSMEEPVEKRTLSTVANNNRRRTRRRTSNTNRQAKLKAA